VEEKIARWSIASMASESAQPAPSAAGPVLYDAKCSLCGKETKVVFKPDGVRPVYCKPCRHKLEKEREEKTASAGAPLPQEVPKPPASKPDFQKTETISFTSSKKNSNADERLKPKRKEINLAELRKTLEESLEEPKEEKGVVKPGETIRFQ
jgi:CxxC-x17-CxxC domain-containing protein